MEYLKESTNGRLLILFFGEILRKYQKINKITRRNHCLKTNVCVVGEINKNV